MKSFLIVFAFLFSVSAAHAQIELPWVKDVGARKTPSSKKMYWVNDYGKTTDSNAVITKTIQKAIDECAKKGGGIVAFKPGQYLMGSIFIKSGVHLKVDKGVLILGSQDFADYPEIDEDLSEPPRVHRLPRCRR